MKGPVHWMCWPPAGPAPRKVLLLHPVTAPCFLARFATHQTCWPKSGRGITVALEFQNLAFVVVATRLHQPCPSALAGHRAKAELLRRLAAVLRALLPLQEAAGMSPRPVTLHAAIALSHSLLPRVARLPGDGCGRPCDATACVTPSKRLPCLLGQCFSTLNHAVYLQNLSVVSWGCSNVGCELGCSLAQIVKAGKIEYS